MKTIMMGLGLAALVVAGCGGNGVKDAAAQTSVAEETVTTAQTVCPVMGGPINKELYADVMGKRVYVCCAGCLEKIKQEPEMYIKKLEDSGVVLENTPK